MRQFKADIRWGVGGLHSAPKDKSAYKERDHIPWRFVAGGKPKIAEVVKVDHTAWVRKCLEDFGSVTPGMTRGQVEQRFAMDCGLQVPSPVRFVHPDCPCFKIDVEFKYRTEPNDQNRAIMGDKDRVTSVSKPYIELPHLD